MKLIRQHRDAVAVSDETREQAALWVEGRGGWASCVQMASIQRERR